MTEQERKMLIGHVRKVLKAGMKALNTFQQQPPDDFADRFDDLDALIASNEGNLKETAVDMVSSGMRLVLDEEILGKKQDETLSSPSE